MVLGGGFGGLETAFDLRLLAGDRAKITLVSDSDHFLFKPNSIYVPFGMDPEKLKVPLAKPAARKNIELIQAKAHGIDPDARRVELDGRSIPYDFLVVATGADMRAGEIPGLGEHAISPWTPAEMLRLRAGFQGLLSGNGKGKQPACPLRRPAEQQVLRAAVRDRADARHLAAPQRRPREHRDRLVDLREQLHPGLRPAPARGRRGRVRAPRHRRPHRLGRRARRPRSPPPTPTASSSSYDLLVAFPPYIAATSFPGLDADERGFLATELGSRRLTRHPEIFAVGDAADFPVKQAFLAFLQADAAASHLAAELLGGEPELDFDPVSMCVMEQFDKATFAQVPLRLTGDPAKPIEVRPDANGDYRVGSSKAWRAGKKMLGHSVPWRFSRGEPFHGGAFWRGMDLGLRAMSGVLAK